MLEEQGQAGALECFIPTPEMVEAGVDALIRVPLLHSDHCQTDYDEIVTSILTAAFRCRAESSVFGEQARAPR